MVMYGDLTIRNYLNDLYDINHKVRKCVKRSQTRTLLHLLTYVRSS